jgi:hypothetical protein
MIRNIRRRRFEWILLGAGLTLVTIGQVKTTRAAEPPAPAVALTIDYGDGVQKHFPRLTWSKGMTVLDLMQAAKAHRRGIDFQYRGSGATAFLLQIDDLKNEGRGRNWLYRINGSLADRGFAVQTLQPEDQVRWVFGEYQEP